MVEDCYHRRDGTCEIGRSDYECIKSCSANLRRTKAEVWTRVMGYHRPVEFFNEGKQEEHRGRLHFREVQA